jgi:hypothetical protein
LDLENVVSHCLVLPTNINGSCLDYLTSVDVPFKIVKEGMDYAKPVALKYVIGAYMLTNGDGTICVQWNALNKIIKEAKLEKSVDWLKMKSLLSIANPACGDAVANILLLECVMRDNDYNFMALFNLYRDRPSELSKATVTYPKAFTNTHDGMKIIEPEGLQ